MRIQNQDMQLLAHLQENPTNYTNDLSNDIFEFPEMGKFLDAMLPKSKKENLNAHGKRKPLQPYQLIAMYRTPFKVEQLKKLFSIYYKISYDKRNLLSIQNEITGKTIVVDLNKDLFGYIKITTFEDSNCHKMKLTIEIPMPKYNQDLFKKILSKKLL